MTDLFRPSFRWTGAMEASLERDGHLVLPGVLQPHAVEELTAAVQRVQGLAGEALHALHRRGELLDRVRLEDPRQDEVAVPLERGLHRAGPPEARPEQVRHP